MLLPAQENAARRNRRRALVGLSLAAVLLLMGAGAWLVYRSTQPRAAPEADSILRIQASLPFQVLIPAYLPAKFHRETAAIRTDQRGPQGEPALQLVYSTKNGDRLVLNEWIPENATAAAGSVRACRCVCASNTLCSSNRLMVDVGPLRVTAEMSAAQLLTAEQLRAVLTTLGPAANLQTYTQLKEVPALHSTPPAAEIPVSSNGVQEVVLIVSAEGYSPAHFSAAKDIPVRLVFRQLGPVGCGNELLFHSGPANEDKLVLSGPGDSQTLEFTPRQAGDFPFYCPHGIYQGLMTVLE